MSIMNAGLTIFISFMLLAVACVPAAEPTATPFIVFDLQATIDASEEATRIASSTPAATLPVSEFPEAVVVNVVDGDTIDVLMDGQELRIRYIGVDTPETVHPTRGEEPYGREASGFNKSLVSGQTVYLEKDVSDTDRFGRLLRYVWLEDGTMVNARLVAEGYAQVSTFPPDVKYAQKFLELQRSAQEQGLGLWGLASDEGGEGECDPAYPTVCIPQPPPDLDCGLPPDPHGFYGNKDGTGCEG